MIESVISSLSSGVLGAMFQNRSRLDELRCEHLALQIRLMQGGAGPVIDAPLGDLVPEDERQDWIVLGERGSGKTALGVTLAQLVAGDQEIYALGFRKWASDQLGIQTVTKGKLKDLRDCVLLVENRAALVTDKARGRDDLAAGRGASPERLGDLDSAELQPD